MRRLIILLTTFAALIAVTYSCGNNNNANYQTSKTDTLVNKAGATVSEEYKEGARLVAANDCLTCHPVNRPDIGPSFSDIANKYEHKEKYADYLGQSVLRGSKGVWAPKEIPAHSNVQFNNIREMDQVHSVGKLNGMHPTKYYVLEALRYCCRVSTYSSKAAIPFEVTLQVVSG